MTDGTSTDSKFKLLNSFNDKRIQLLGRNIIMEIILL